MDADIQGCLVQINKVWRAFEHNGKPMTKSQVTKVLIYGFNKGYKSVSQLTDEEINRILETKPAK